MDSSLRCTWKRISAIDSFFARSSHTVTSVRDGSVFVCGGETGPRELVDASNALWNFQNEKFLAVETQEQVALLGHCAFGFEGKLVVFGGRRGGTMGEGDDFADLWEFSEGKGWQLLNVAEGACVPRPRSYAGSASCGSTFFVFGGCSGHDRLNDLWKFDSSKGSWEELRSENDGPCPRGGAMVFAPSSEDVYIFGGFAGKELGDVWHFSNGKWRTIEGGTDVFTPRSVAACANLNGLAFIFGGETAPSSEGHKGAGSFSNEVVVFNPKDDGWTKVKCDGDIPEPRGWTEWDVAGENKILLVGGLSEKAERLNDAYILEINT